MPNYTKNDNALRWWSFMETQKSNFPGLCIVTELYALIVLQSTPDNSNLQGKSKEVRDIGSLSYREFEANNRKWGNKQNVIKQWIWIGVTKK